MQTFQQLQAEELVRAREHHPRIASNHEGHSVIREELEEYWDEVKKRNPDHNKLLKELIQTAAMCQRTAEDLLLP